MFDKFHANNAFQQKVTSGCLMLIQIREYEINRAMPHLTHHRPVICMVFNDIFS